MPLEHFKHGAVQRKISPWGKAWTGGQGKAGAASRIKASESGAFRAPSWAQKLDGYRAELDVVLNGEIAHKRPLDRFSCYLVGKSPDVCNLPLTIPQSVDNMRSSCTPNFKSATSPTSNPPTARLWAMGPTQLLLRSLYWSSDLGDAFVSGAPRGAIFSAHSSMLIR